MRSFARAQAAEPGPAPQPGLIVKPRADAPSAAVRAADEGPGAVSKAFTSVQTAVRWAINGPSVPEWKTREVVNDPDTRWADAATLRNATAALATRKPEEEAALAKLGARAADYTTLATACGKDLPAKHALQSLLLDGRLTQKDLKGGADALAHLSRIAAQPLAPGLDRTELLTNLLEEMENPTKISQEGKGTCVATTATIVLARKSPAEYARLIADLAKPEGQATLKNGKAITRHTDWNNTNDSGRTPSLRLLQPALMEFGNFFMHYDNDRDRHTLETKYSGVWASIKESWGNMRRKLSIPGGLESHGSNKILEGLTGDDYKAVGMVTRLNRNATWDRMVAATQAGKSVPCGLNWEGGGHKILLDKVENGFAYYTNPWGSAERMTVAEFKGNLTDANLPRS